MAWRCARTGPGGSAGVFRLRYVGEIPSSFASAVFVIFLAASAASCLAVRFMGGDYGSRHSARYSVGVAVVGCLKFQHCYKFLLHLFLKNFWKSKAGGCAATPTPPEKSYPSASGIVTTHFHGCARVLPPAPGVVTNHASVIYCINIQYSAPP